MIGLDGRENFFQWIRHSKNVIVSYLVQVRKKKKILRQDVSSPWRRLQLCLPQKHKIAAVKFNVFTLHLINQSTLHWVASFQIKSDGCLIQLVSVGKSCIVKHSFVFKIGAANQYLCLS